MSRFRIFHPSVVSAWGRQSHVVCHVVEGVEHGDSKRINHLLKLNWESSEVNQKRIGAGESRQDIYRNDISLVELFAACLSI